MANQYAVSGGGNWSAATTWESTPGGGDDTGPPAGGDDVYLVVGSGNVTVDGATNALGNFYADGYTNTLAANNAIDVQGTVYLGGTLTGSANISCGGSLTSFSGLDISGYTGTVVFDASAGTPTLDMGSTSLPALQVNNAGVDSFIAQNAISAASFTLTAGKYSDSGYTQTIAGLISIGGTLTSTGKWTQSASGNLSSPANEFAELEVNATGTLTGNVYAKKLSGSGTVDLAGNEFLMTLGGNNFWTFTGTFTSDGSGWLAWNPGDDYSNAADIIIAAAGPDISIYGGTDKTITVGNLDTDGNDIYIRAAAGKWGKLVISGNLIGDGAIKLGRAADATQLGKIAFGNGIHVIGSIAADCATTDANEVDFGSSYITLSGEITGRGDADKEIDFVNTACAIVGGTVDWLLTDPTVVVQCYGTTDGGNNNGAYVKFDQHAPPGSLVGMGVGI